MNAKRIMIKRIVNRDDNTCGLGRVTDHYFISAWQRAFTAPLPEKHTLERELRKLSDADIVHLYTQVCLELFK